jgi:carbon starvation protein
MLGMPAAAAKARTSVEAILTDEQKAVVPTTRAANNVMAFRDKGLQNSLGLTEDQRASVQTALKEPAGVLSRTRQVWNSLLLVYCVIASVLPMWLLLQPRGHLGGYFLYAALAVGVVGFVFGGQKAEYPAFRGWEVAAANGTIQNLFPILFITIACGACSGFHSIIASGTTSKQLRSEADARPVGYGAMLLESMVAVISLCCVMMLRPDSSLLGSSIQPNLVYSNGIGSIFERIGPEYLKLGISFGLMAFTTFVYDTLDVCTRLGRYILQELTGWSGIAGQWIATIATAGVPLVFLLWQPQAADGQPAYMIFWALFGSSNQLLAALTLIGVTVWLWRTYRKPWVVVAVGIPCVFMYVMSMWALLRSVNVIVKPLQAVLAGEADAAARSALQNPVPWVALLLAGLGLLMLIEALWVMFVAGRTPPAASTTPQPAAA